MLCDCLIQVHQDWGKLELSQYLAVIVMMINALSMSHTSPSGKLELSQYLAVTAMMIKALSMSHKVNQDWGKLESVPSSDIDDDKCSVNVSYKSTKTGINWS